MLTASCSGVTVIAVCGVHPGSRRSPGEASCVGPWAVAAPELPPRSPNQRGSAHPKLHSPKLVLFPRSGTALSPLSCASPKMPQSTDPGASEPPTTAVWRSAHTGRGHSRPPVAAPVLLHRTHLLHCFRNRGSGGCKDGVTRAPRARKAAALSRDSHPRPRREVVQNLDAWACGRNSSLRGYL